MFPIHDGARADDIRMRRRRAAYLLGGIVLAGWMLSQQDSSGQAQGHHHDVEVAIDQPPVPPIPPIPPIPRIPSIPAITGFPATGRPLPAGDTPSRSIETGSLFVGLSCADSVTLLPDPDLHGRVIVSTRPGQDAALRGVSLDGGAVTDSCSGEPGDVVLRLPPAMPLRIQQTDAVDIRGGRFTGPVTIEGTGSGTVTLDGTGPLTVRQRSAGDVSVAEVDGPVDAGLHGSGDLRIGGGAITRLSAVVTSSGDLSLGRATIGPTRLVLHGEGDVSANRIEGPVDLQAAGSGDVRIASVDADTLQVAAEGSGDISVLGGRIGTLTGARDGSGDLVVRATIGGGSLSHHGSGDVTLPNVTGTLSRTGDTD